MNIFFSIKLFGLYKKVDIADRNSFIKAISDYLNILKSYPRPP